MDSAGFAGHGAVALLVIVSLVNMMVLMNNEDGILALPVWMWGMSGLVWFGFLAFLTLTVYFRPNKENHVSDQKLTGSI